MSGSPLASVKYVYRNIAPSASCRLNTTKRDRAAACRAQKPSANAAPATIAASGTARAFAVDPRGAYLQIGGEDGNLVAYRIDPATGSLSETSSAPGLGDIHNTIIRYLE